MKNDIRFSQEKTQIFILVFLKGKKIIFISFFFMQFANFEIYDREARKNLSFSTNYFNRINIYLHENEEATVIYICFSKYHQ